METIYNFEKMLKEFNNKSVCINDNLGRKVIGTLFCSDGTWGLRNPYEIGHDAQSNSVFMIDWIPHTDDKRWFFTNDWPKGVSLLDGEIEDHWLKQSGQKIIDTMPTPKIIV